MIIFACCRIDFLFIAWRLNKYLKGYEENKTGTIGWFKMCMSSVFHRKDLCEARVKPKTSSNLVNEPSSADGHPKVPEQRWLACHYTKLGRWTYFGQWTPQYQSRDALHTSTHNLADETTLADGPPLAEQRCLENQYTQLGRWNYFGWCPPPVPE